MFDKCTSVGKGVEKEDSESRLEDKRVVERVKPSKRISSHDEIRCESCYSLEATHHNFK